MSAYYPGCKVRLLGRFDDLLDSDALKKSVPQKPSKNLSGIKDERGPLKVVEEVTPEGATRFKIVGPGEKAATAGAGSNAGGDDPHTFVLEGIIPRKADLGINGVRLADTLSLEIRWMDMPFDPRVIRSCAVWFYLGVLTPEQYARGVRGERRAPKSDAGPGEPLNLIDDEWTDARGMRRSNLRFEGWVDKWAMTWGEDEPLVKLECADNTRLLIDQQHPPQLTLDPKLPIDEAVAGLLAHFPQMQGFAVVYKPETVRNDKVPPRIGQALTGAAAVPGLGPPIAKTGGATGGERGSTWDYLADVCGALGHTIRVEGTDVVIQRPRTLYNGKARARAGDPYAGRTVDGVDYPARAFVYGRNVSELEIAHEYTRRKAQSVEVRSYCPELKSPVVGRFPEKADRIVHANPGDGVADQKWLVHHVTGIKDPARVKKIAEDVYNLSGRQELSVRVRTKNLASFGGDNSDPDLLDIRAGDDFEVRVYREQTASVTDRETALSAPSAAADLLGRLGYPPEIAKTYGEVYANAKLQRVFRVKEGRVGWDASEGVSIELLGINYLEARLDRVPHDFDSDPNEDPTAPR